jgi:hypothetical protein
MSEDMRIDVEWKRRKNNAAYDGRAHWLLFDGRLVAIVYQEDEGSWEWFETLVEGDAEVWGFEPTLSSAKAAAKVAAERSWPRTGPPS